MPMQAESLEVLENAAVPPAQARAIVRAIEIELTGARDVLATKHDLLLTRQELQHEMVGVGTSLRKEIAELGAALRKEIGDVRAEVHASASSITRQMYLAVLGQSAVMLGFAYFLTTQLR
jgi:hypothetical protein